MLWPGTIHFHEAPVVLSRAGVVPWLRNVQFSGHKLARILSIIVVEVESDVGVPNARNAHAAVPGRQYDIVCDKRARARSEVVNGRGEEVTLAHAVARWAQTRAGVERCRRRASSDRDSNRNRAPL